MHDLLIQAQKKAQERDRARKDKFFLATEVLGLDWFAPEVHQELLDQFIEYDSEKPWVQQSDIKDRLILWPRGHLKTVSVQVAVIQAILNFPDIRVLIMQGSIKVTKKLLAAIKSHFTGNAANSRLRELFPEFCADKLGNAEQFTVPNRKKKQLTQATVTVASPNSIKTGEHYDIGFFDDLVNDQNYQKIDQLNKTIEQFQMCEPLLDPPAYRIVTGTRYAFGDLYEEIILKSASTWKISVKTCWTDDGKELRFPRRQTSAGNWCGFTREELEQKRLSNPGQFASQYLNQPVMTATQAFSRELLDSGLVLDLSQVPALSQASLFVDLASTTEVKSDDSVIIAGQVDSLGRMYVTDARGDKWTPVQIALNVIDMALIHRPLVILFEQTASAIYFVQTLRLVCRDKGVTLPIDFMKVDVRADAKATRVLSLAGHIKAGRLKFYAGLPCWEKMVDQFTKFQPGRKHAHDDYPDTVALMVQNLGQHVINMPYRDLRTHPLIRAIEAQADQHLTFAPFEDKLTGSDNSMGDDFAS